MNRHILDNYQSALKLLEKSDISKTGSNLTESCFFQIEKEDVNLNDLLVKSKLNESEINFMDECRFPPQIKIIYKILGDSQREFCYKHFNFMSLSSIIERRNTYINAGQDNLMDIGLSYQGMGWVNVLTLDTSSGLLFLRLDGGSNGYDRSSNYHNFIKTPISDNLKQQMFTFKEFLEILGTDIFQSKIVNLQNCLD